jgi:hypothetical protein
VAVRRRFFPGMCLFDFLLWSESFKGSLKKKNAVSGVFIFGLFNWPNWELGNPSHLAFSCTHATAMVSPKSVELKQGAEETSMEEASDASSSYPGRACPDRSYRISQPRQGEEGPLMRTWQPCLCPCVVHGLEKMESSKVFQVKKEVQG